MTTLLPAHHALQTLSAGPRARAAAPERGRASPIRRRLASSHHSPPVAQIPAVIAQIFIQAKEAGVPLLTPDTTCTVPRRRGAIARYDLEFPVKASYPDIRAFINRTLSTVAGPPGSPSCTSSARRVGDQIVNANIGFRGVRTQRATTMKPDEAQQVVDGNRGAGRRLRGIWSEGFGTRSRPTRSSGVPSGAAHRTPRPASASTPVAHSLLALAHRVAEQVGLRFAVRRALVVRSARPPPPPVAASTAPVEAGEAGRPPAAFHVHGQLRPPAERSRSFFSPRVTGSMTCTSATRSMVRTLWTRSPTGSSSSRISLSTHNNN